MTNVVRLHQDDDPEFAASPLERLNALTRIVADTDLNATAKIVALAIMSFVSKSSGTCFASYQTIAGRSNLKRRATINAVALLKAVGWIEIKMRPGKCPKTCLSNEIRFRCKKVPKTEESTLEKAPLPSARPCTTLVHGHAPPLVHGHAPKQGKPFNKVEKTDASHLQKEPPGDLFEDASASGPTVPAAPSKKQTALDFEAFWRVYPRRVARRAAEKIFHRLIKSGEATVEEILAGAERYAAERAGENPQFTKHPSTWLNQGCWADEEPPAYSGQHREQPSFRDLATEWIARDGWDQAQLTGEFGQ